MISEAENYRVNDKMRKAILFAMFFIALSSSLAFATVNSVSVEGGAVSKDVYKNSPFQISVQVDSVNETSLTVTGAWNNPSISCDASSVQVSGGVATFTGCTIPVTGTYTFTATCGGKYDTMDFISNEIPAWSISLANVTSETSVKVTATIDAAGSTLQGVTANITTPSGWTMTSGTPTRSLGDITGTADVQWVFTKGSPGTLNDITVTVIVTNPADSKSESFSGEEEIITTTTSTTTTTTLPGSTTTTTISTGTGTGSGTGTGQKLGKAIHSWVKMQKGKANVMKIADETIGFRQITIEVKNPANNVKITVTKLAGKPASVVHEVTGKVYKYIEISAENIADENISSAKIQFDVEKTWIADNALDKNTIALNRYADDAWTKLPTSLLSENDTYIIYEAETPGFSIFAITGETVSATTTTTTTTTTMPVSPTPPGVTTTTAPVAVTTTVPAEVTTTTLPAAPTGISPWVWVIAIALILILGVLYWKREEVKKVIQEMARKARKR